MRQDLRQAWRMVWRSKMVSATAILLVSLGIGVNGTVFSLVRGILLDTLPFPEADRIQDIRRTLAGTPGHELLSVEFHQWRAQSQAFTALGAYQVAGFTLTGRGDAEQMEAAEVSTGVIETLGVRPMMGRPFTLADETPGTRVAIISHLLWERFGARQDTVGDSLVLDGAAYRIVGVMPRGFAFPAAHTSCWVPMGFMAGGLRASMVGGASQIGITPLRVIGRLATGVTPDQARAEGRLVLSRPPFSASRGSRTEFDITTLQARLVGPVRSLLLALQGAVAVVLLLVSLNVASLLMARNLGRQRDLAVRSCLGATRWQLVRSVLMEAALVAMGGCVLGIGLAIAGTNGLKAFSPGFIPRVDDIQVNALVVGLCVLAAASSALIASVPSALTTARLNVIASLRGHLGEGRLVWRKPMSGLIQRALVSLEIACSLALLAAALRLVAGFLAVANADVGFDASDAVTARVELPAYKYLDAEARVHLIDRLREGAAGVPGAVVVGVTNIAPFSGDDRTADVMLPSAALSDPTARATVSWRVVDEGYFRVLKIGLRHGRLLDARDQQNSAPVIVVNESFARRVLGQDAPVGQRVLFRGRMHEVVGVVGDARHAGPTQSADPTAYTSYRQLPDRRYAAIPATWALPKIDLMLSTTLSPLELSRVLRERVRAIDPDLVLRDVLTMNDRIHRTMARTTFAGGVMGILALVSLLLAGIGVYGIVTYWVSSRTREIGIRVAVGATRGKILSLVLGSSLVSVGAGVALGLVGASYAMSAVGSLLPPVPVPSAPIGGLAVAVLGAAALLACVAPARRALRIDPVDALRLE